jgi:hypothetical protein
MRADKTKLGSLAMQRPSSRPIVDRANDPKQVQTLRWTLLLLVLELTFEGLVRKLDIKGSSIAVFLLKDVIVAAMGLQVIRMKRPPALDFLYMAYLVEFILFLPLIIRTAMHDPVLAVFGAKEYLLYPIVAFAVFLVFEKATIPEITRFFRWIALLVIPTAAVAFLEIHLPDTHWLNMSVDGETLEAFSAGGYLRVSSTFSFVAQFCSFINVEVFIAMVALNDLRDVKGLKKLALISIVPLLIISSYITGSRGAVLINCCIIIFAVGLSLLKLQARSAFRVIAIVIGLLFTLFVAQYLFPDAFTAYSTREQGQLIGASSEIRERIYDVLFGWTSNIFTTPIFGYGLGIMSNGSEKISHYAAATRLLGWTETDYATTLFEGGLYMIFVWYGFRYYVILQVVYRFLVTPSGSLGVPSAFCIGYVVSIGMTATLGIQPPTAIWWWFAVGSALVFWWKCIEPKTETVAPDKPTEAPPPRKFRGRSVYADRLHAEKK